MNRFGRIPASCQRCMDPKRQQNGCVGGPLKVAVIGASVSTDIGMTGRSHPGWTQAWTEYAFPGQCCLLWLRSCCVWCVAPAHILCAAAQGAIQHCHPRVTPRIFPGQIQWINGAVRGTTTLYMAICLHTRIPDDVDIVIMEYSVNNRRQKVCKHRHMPIIVSV
jgi:hypothetical protein